MSDGISLFNLDWYLAQNPDVAKAVEKGLISAEQHFELFGKSEGRSASPLFNVQHYLASNPDVAAAVDRGEMDAYDHFLTHGAGEGRSPLSLFNETFYLAQNRDVAEAVGNGSMTAVEHFLRHGINEPRAFNPAIDLAAYLNANPDIAAAFKIGSDTSQGSSANQGETASVQAKLSSFAASADAPAPSSNGLGSILEHLMVHGAKEGRDLGNGIRLSDFANDPKFADALASGDLDAALGRVSDVAPFLPSFQPPVGWTPAADTPIPTDFVPPEGISLVIPEGVIIPEGTKLPDSFAPVVPPVTPPGGGAPTYEKGWGILSDQAFYTGAENSSPELFAGKGNLASDQFAWARSASAGIELGIDARYTKDPLDIELHAGDRFIVDSARGADVRFAYSVASTTGTELNLEAYDYKLSIDTDPGVGTNFVEFTLTRDTTTAAQNYNNQNSSYDWVRAVGTGIIDDGGADHVTQNIQSFDWYNGDGVGPLQLGNSYAVRLQAVQKNSMVVVAERQVTIEVQPLAYTAAEFMNLSTAASLEGALFAGTANPVTGFMVSTNDAAKLELGLDLRYKGDGTDQSPVHGNVFKVSSSDATNMRFAYSVASTATEGSGYSRLDLEKYDFKLKIDVDKSGAEDFLVFDLKEQDTVGAANDAHKSPYEWVMEMKEGQKARVIADDGGDGHVTQNIQALNWYLDDAGSVTDGVYNIQLEAYVKGTAVVVAATEIVVMVGSISPEVAVPGLFVG